MVRNGLGLCSQRCLQLVLPEPEILLPNPDYALDTKGGAATQESPLAVIVIGIELSQ